MSLNLMMLDNAARIDSSLTTTRGDHKISPIVAHEFPPDTDARHSSGMIFSGGHLTRHQPFGMLFTMGAVRSG